MSKTPQNKPVQPDDEDSGYGYDDYDEPDSKPPPKSQAKQQAKPQAKSQTNSRQAQPIPERRPSSTYRPRSVERRRDPYPILIGAIIGVAVIGVVLIAYLLGMKAGSSNGPAALIPAGAADTPTEPAPEDSVPRISMADFIKLYSSPTDRPYIIDVRPKDSYDQAHIKGAVSIPEDQITGHLGDLPKGKLIVTYCD